jgi:hypothetical protein
MRQLSVLGVTDFYTLTYIGTCEFDTANMESDAVEETFAVALDERGDLRVAFDYFKAGKDDILKFLEHNRFKIEKEDRILADEKQKEHDTEAALLYKREKDKFKIILRDYQHAMKDSVNKFKNDGEESHYQGIDKTNNKKPVFKMKKKMDDKKIERP